MNDHEVLFSYLKKSISYYEPNKVNRKKIKELFSCIPYFVSGEDQDILYPLFLSSFTNEKDFEPLKSEDPGLNVNPKITILLFFFIFEVIFLIW